jgi:hypothetical protein
MVTKNQEVGGRWKNWSESVWYDAPLSQKYVKFPRTEEDLRDILADAAENGIKVRASGQRHSQPPQIVDDNRNDGSINGCLLAPTLFVGGCKEIELYVVDMSLYQDIVVVTITTNNNKHEPSVAQSPLPGGGQSSAPSSEQPIDQPSTEPTEAIRMKVCT